MSAKLLETTEAPKPQRVGTLTLHGMDTMNKKGRLKVASWLRRQAEVVENEGGAKGQIASRYTAKYNIFASVLVALGLVVSGCVTKYDDIVSDFHTIQNSNQCTTVAFDQRKFNAETVEPPAISCPCDELKPVRRLVVKSGQSPEVMACLAPVQQSNPLTTRYEPMGDGYTVRLLDDTSKNRSYFIPSGQLHHQASLASTYVPAIGNAAAGGAIGGGIAAAQAARITQNAGSFNQPINTSTLLINGPVPPGVAR